jgi:hypothetical protein
MCRSAPLGGGSLALKLAILFSLMLCVCVEIHCKLVDERRFLLVQSPRDRR